MKKLLNHIVEELKKACESSKYLSEDMHFELTKEEVITDFNLLYAGISKWEEYLRNNEIKKILDDYKKYESIISELELCLLDYDETFNIRDISCSYFEYGKKLIEFQGRK